jgi:hypothetical protein
MCNITTTYVIFTINSLKSKHVLLSLPREPGMPKKKKNHKGTNISRRSAYQVYLARLETLIFGLVAEVFQSRGGAERTMPGQ